MAKSRPLLSGLLLVALLFAFTKTAVAAGNVGFCDEAHLRLALAGGGLVTITCAGTITLTSPIQIDTGTEIRGNLNAIISGGKKVPVFFVFGTALVLDHVVIEDGLAASVENGFEGGAVVIQQGTLVAFYSSFLFNSSNSGGAIANHGKMVLIKSEVSLNSAAIRGGGITNDGYAEIINSCVCVNTSHSGSFGGGAIYNTGNLVVRNSFIAGNAVDSSDNFGSGGGILNAAKGMVDVSETTFQNNRAGFCTDFREDLANALGGALANFGGNATVKQSAFSGNAACDGGAIGNFDSVAQNGSVLNVTNSTFASNIAGGSGGAIFNGNQSGSTDQLATALVDYGTFSRNEPTNISNDRLSLASAMTIKDTILSSATFGNCNGDVTDGGYNLDSGGACHFTSGTSLSQTPPQLGALADNGGATQSMKLLAGSPALDKIPPGVNGCGNPVTTDQRGIVRPQGVGCDIGAYEATQTSTVGSKRCVGTFAGQFIGDVSIGSDSACAFLGGSISGNIHLQGGLLALSNVIVNGNIEATAGALSIGPSTNITGNVEMHNLAGNLSLSSVCGANIQGNLEIHNNATAIIIGSDNVGVPGSTPSNFCAGNNIAGDLHVHNNSATVQITDNTVAGNLDVHNNSGPAQVIDNTANGNFTCHGNSTITGGPNVSSGNAQGQCYQVHVP